MTALFLTLCSCSRPASPEALAQSVREEYNSLSNLTMVMDMTADYGTEVYDFSLRYEGGTDSGSITVTQPESAVGIIARIDSESTSLEYDGVVLDTGEFSSDGLSPLDAVPVMLEQWSGGFPTDFYFESRDGTDLICIGYELSGSVHLATWFDAQTFLPHTAEISSDGRAVIRCTFENVTID